MSTPPEPIGRVAGAGLAAFSGVFWSVAVAVTFYSPRIGVLVGGLASWGVLRAARESPGVA